MMDFSNIKLIVSDMDGTLLNSDHNVSDSFFTLFRKLQKENIHFAAASGRQYQSIVEKLKAIKEDITIISENGGFGKTGKEDLFVFDLPADQIKTPIELLRKQEEPCIVLCGKKAAYVESKDEKFISTFSQFYSSFQVVEDLTKITDDTIFKIAVYHKECSETHILPLLKNLPKDFQILVSGKNWLDISHHNANKGKALTLLQEKLGVSKEETMVFGDYNNDLKMLSHAKFSYAMANAHPNVKKIAQFQTKSNDENGVETVLEQVLNSRK